MLWDKIKLVLTNLPWGYAQKHKCKSRHIPKHVKAHFCSFSSFHALVCPFQHISGFFLFSAYFRHLFGLLSTFQNLFSFFLLLLHAVFSKHLSNWKSSAGRGYPPVCWCHRLEVGGEEGWGAGQVCQHSVEPDKVLNDFLLSHHILLPG